MNKMRMSIWRKIGTVGLLLLIGTFVFLSSYLQPAHAQPAEGTLLRDLVIPDSDGVGVGFDGMFLYWLDFSGTTLHKIDTLGNPVADIPIVGCTATVISFDASRNVFWGADGTQISQIATDGTCTPQFDVAGNLPGDCDTGFGCLSLVDGINHDPSDDTIWYSPDASQRVYHYDTFGNLLGFFDVNDPPNDMLPECGFNYSSGIATGVAPIMYLAANGCETIFKYDKSGNKLGSFVIGALRHEDMECDNVTFADQNTDAIWIKDAFDDHIRAFAVARGTCVLVEEVKGRMTGGGSVFGSRVTHGFELHCDASQEPNNLEVNWDKGNKFHLESLMSASCTDDPDIDESPPVAGFDTYEGEGTGRCNGLPATAKWTFTDAGEPGNNDTATIEIMGGCSLSVSGNLKNGNHQAHAE